MKAVTENATDWILEVTRRNADRTFLVDAVEGGSLTFGEFYVLSLSVGADLTRRGYAAGDRVVVILENSAGFAALYFGLMYAGLVAVPVNPMLSAEEIAYIVRHSHARLVVVSAVTMSKVDTAMLPGEGIEVLVAGTKTGEWDQMALPHDDSFRPFRATGAEDDLAVVYTSGTTAEPKGVVHRVRDLIDNARLFGGLLGIGRENRFYNMLAMTYLGGYYNLLLLPFANESSVVIGRTFGSMSAVGFWGPVADHGVNTLWVVPSIMSILLEMDRGELGAEYCRRAVKLALVGTAPLPASLRAEFEKKYGLRPYENYGLSETLFISTHAPGFVTDPGSVGRTLPDVQVRVLDKHGAELDAGGEGEIQVRTPHLMRGYYDTRKKGPEELSRSDWFSTGDLGRMSESGELYITGRKKDLIIRGGINISPAAIENVLYSHPAVAECAVVGVPHKILGEEICAVVRLLPGHDFGAVQPVLSRLCEEKCAKIKWPNRILELAEFPHTSTGKIQKRKIRAWLTHKTNDTVAKEPVAELPGEKVHFTPSRVVSASHDAISIRFNTIVYEMQRRGQDPIVLSLGEAFFDIPVFSLDNLPAQKINHYSHPRGIPELRKKLADYFLEEYDVHFDPEKEIVITAGSKAAIYMALLTIINPGDEVMYPEPAWVSYPEQIKFCYGVPVSVPYHRSVFEWEDFITNRTRMVIINNPQNPSGKIYNLEELSHIHQLSRKYNLFVLSDEAYSDFLLDPEEFISFANLDVEKRRTLVVNSMSKNFGISGWRLGYLITNPSLIEQFSKVNQHLITCPPTVLEYYMACHFDEIIRVTKPQMRSLVLFRRRMREEMDRLGLKYLPGDSTFYFFVSIEGSKLRSEEFCVRLLREKGVCVVPGIGYGGSCDQFVRVSVGAESAERVRDGLEKLARFIEETS